MFTTGPWAGPATRVLPDKQAGHRHELHTHAQEPTHTCEMHPKSPFRRSVRSAPTEFLPMGL